MDVLTRIAEVDRLYVKQRFAMMLNHYDISLLAEDGVTPTEPVCYVRQKRMKIKEEINFFASENESSPVLRLKKRSVLEFHGTTEVQLGDGTVIGTLRKAFGSSLFRSTWEIRDTNDKVVATARESSMFVAIARRFADMIPYLPDVFQWLPFNFEIRIGGRVVGSYRRPLNGFTDRYILDLTGDVARQIDRRVAMALTVALDALQDR